MALVPACADAKPSDLDRRVHEAHPVRNRRSEDGYGRGVVTEVDVSDVPRPSHLARKGGGPQPLRARRSQVKPSRRPRTLGLISLSVLTVVLGACSSKASTSTSSPPTTVTSSGPSKGGG